MRDENIIKVKDVANILGCGINRAYEIVGQRDFPKIKIGKRFYILESKFYDWLRSYTGTSYRLK